jgi:hypothetical protein
LHTGRVVMRLHPPWPPVVITSIPGIFWAEQLWEFIPQPIIDPTRPAIAVRSVWAVLALDRRWRPRPGQTGMIACRGTTSTIEV